MPRVISSATSLKRTSIAKALFLDRDGIINRDLGYVFRQQDFSFVPGIFELCSRAQDLGYLLIVITNQSGIARGYFTEEDYAAITHYMVSKFAARGISGAGFRMGPSITDVIHCPELEGPMRKPAPGMFLLAQQRYDLNMAACVSVGDKQRDVEAAQAAGCGKNFLFDGSFEDVLSAL